MFIKLIFCHEGNGFAGFINTTYRCNERKKRKREAALAASLFRNVFAEPAKLALWLEDLRAG